MFYLACKHNEMTMVNFVIDQLKKQGMSDADIETKVINTTYDRSESTPLIRAAGSGAIEIAKYLLERYAVDPK